jgi:hypothetical protein
MAEAVKGRRSQLLLAVVVATCATVIARLTPILSRPAAAGGSTYRPRSAWATGLDRAYGRARAARYRGISRRCRIAGRVGPAWPDRATRDRGETRTSDQARHRNP